MLHNFSRDSELSGWLKTDDLSILFYDLPGKFSRIYKSYEYARVGIILEGEVLTEINKKIFRCDETKILIMSPESNVNTTFEKHTKALVFEVDDGLIKRVGGNVCRESGSAEDLLVEDRILSTQITPEIQDVCTRLINTLHSKETKDDYLLSLYAQELIYRIIQINGAYRVLKIKAIQPVNKAINYMKDHYMLPMTIKQISAELKMSETNFCQYFKKSTGSNPKEYLTNIRMEKAKDILLNASVTDTAYSLGYENISRFIAVFKEKYNMTPKQFKLSQNIVQIR